MLYQIKPFQKLQFALKESDFCQALPYTSLFCRPLGKRVTLILPLTGTLVAQRLSKNEVKVLKQQNSYWIL